MLLVYNYYMTTLVMPLVSIIVPVYNTPRKYLAQSLDSISKQSYENIEIILVDDGSDEGTANFCDSYVKKHDGWRVIHQVNSGASTARNVGLSQATGRYVQFIDSDDVLDPHITERLLGNFEDSEVDIALCRYYTFENTIVDAVEGEPFKYTGVWKADLRPDSIFTTTSPSIWKMMFRMDFLKANNLRFDKSLVRGEDLLFGCQALAMSNKVATVNDVLYYYRVNTNSSVVSNKNPDFLTTFSALKKLKKFLIHNGLYSLYKQGYMRLVFNGSLLYDYTDNTSLFIKQYAQLHEFTKALINTASESFAEEIKEDGGCADTLLVAEETTPTDYFVRQYQLSKQKAQQSRAYAVGLEQEMLMLRGELEKAKQNLSDLQNKKDEIEAELKSLEYIKPILKKLVINIKHRLNT